MMLYGEKDPLEIRTKIELLNPIRPVEITIRC
jgi:hypothetical protein